MMLVFSYTIPWSYFVITLVAVTMTVNPMFHTRNKHIEIDFHFCLEEGGLRNFGYKICILRKSN